MFGVIIKMVMQLIVRELNFREDFCAIKKKSPKQKGKKKENAKGGKKGEEKKSLLNATEIGEALVQMLYSGVPKNIEINGEIGCLLSEK